MKLNPLGRSGLKVSVLALGTMNFGSDWHGTGAVEEKTAERLVDLALEYGVNLIDTADIYGFGAAEEMLGRILRRNGRRSKLLIATKVLGRMKPEDPLSGGLSARHIEEALNDSLRRLQTETVDLYMPHAGDPHAPVAESLEAFSRALKAGKVRVLGVSNLPRTEFMHWLEIAAGSGGPRLEFNQVQYSLAARFIEDDLSEVCARGQIGILAWSPLGGGFLSGKYSSKVRPSGRRRNPAAAFPSLPEGRLSGLLKVLNRVSAQEGVTPAQAALGWLMAKPCLSSALIGASHPDQLRETLAARPLSARSLSFLDRASELCAAVPAGR